MHASPTSMSAGGCTMRRLCGGLKSMCRTFASATATAYAYMSRTHPSFSFASSSASTRATTSAHAGMTVSRLLVCMTTGEFPVAGMLLSGPFSAGKKRRSTSCTPLWVGTMYPNGKAYAAPGLSITAGEGDLMKRWSVSTKMTCEHRFASGVRPHSTSAPERSATGKVQYSSHSRWSGLKRIVGISSMRSSSVDRWRTRVKALRTEPGEEAALR
mmetsp:Transcript_30928/g.100704  ORF Transcript_30928/g.100704 Transcript_30928/m.100704 type:complete len:214 (-) Transcript_30928:395-1036(-)